METGHLACVDKDTAADVCATGLQMKALSYISFEHLPADIVIYRQRSRCRAAFRGAPQQRE